MYVCLVFCCRFVYRHDIMVAFFFLFKQKTASDMRMSDWSSYVCSSDLLSPKAVIGDSGLGIRKGESTTPIVPAPGTTNVQKSGTAFPNPQSRIPNPES